MPLPRLPTGHVIDIPRHEPSTIVSERNCPNLLALAFPMLFPYGRGVFGDAGWPVVLKSPTKFFAHLLSYYDRR
jgi:hypothetical protein